MIPEVEAIEAAGKNPLMAKGFVEMTINDLIKKIETPK
jgi:hypothetical protein